MVLTILGLVRVLCFVKVKLSVKVKLFVLLLCVCAILPAKAVPEMTYNVSGGTLSTTHPVFFCCPGVQLFHVDFFGEAVKWN